ncbi:MAG: helix-turn-helix transcriptional regulator [Alphaproteobacteria bacterium]|nr:helix-turn-helix transcriptional regulator [Alphaproteobacteria bacterium]MBV9371078.1 helix-turn-helix transcriptional regulator [Alphaproteobacteria bacterium]MBV9901548.1 helix-turn-helix transcriptional regulator [Alphaproteobacteria bacterium]
MSDELQAERSESVALLVREELARRRLSRQWLADQARVSLSTLEKALSGRRPFTLATVVRLEQALGTALRGGRGNGAGEGHTPGGFAPEEMGAYARPAVRWLEGEYLTLRPSFAEPGAVYAYRTLIEWDADKSHLHFAESDRVDTEFEQQGFVSFPHLSGHIYLVTSSAGQYRVAILSRPSGGGALHGVLTTLVAGQGAQLIPAATPITLMPSRAGAQPAYGLIRRGDRCWNEYRDCVERIAGQGFVLFPGVATGTAG